MNEEDEQKVIWQKTRMALYKVLNGIEFTPIERKIVQTLADGNKHRLDDVVASLDDSQANRGNLAVHICNLRFKLLPINHTIICESHGRITYYRYIILLSSLIES